ncbi:Cupin [Sphingomonas gellani]|uniref:Cupin n=1 Tax=Sphingomonas gellani TaxID=1166340 RepID=A0A1H8GNR1_9SPHN|nr:cupin domain-containing protein [Sphingomonas gellani]SEN44918.1 Cupin [Sphingomonas gellani]
MSRAALAAMLAPLLVMTAAMPAGAADDPTSFASAAEVRSTITAMEREMKPGQGFAWRPVLRSGDTAVALEIWKKPGRPAVHPDQAEYVTVMAGSGTLISGGRLDEPSTTRPDLIEGRRIVGGTTRALKPGDVALIPAGTPHWFGITGSRLVLLGTKLTQASR